MKITRKIIALLLVLLVVVACFTGCGAKLKTKKAGRNASQEQTVSITVDIVKDGKTRTVKIDTSKKYLAGALADEGIIEYAEDGYYTTVDGITADHNADGAWWCITKGGEMAMVGMNELEIADGDKFEITYTK